MALNFKLAMLVSLGFIASMCWLVNQVARPVLDLGPTAARPVASLAVQTPTLALTTGAESAAERFTRASPADTAITAPALDDERFLVAAPEDTGGPFVQAKLPPLHVAPEPSTPAAATEPTLRRPPSLSAVADPWSAEAAESGGSPDAVGLAAAEAPGPAAAPTESVVYRVQRGDSLSKIARRTWGSDQRRLIRALMDANPRVARRGGRLLAGEEIIIPAVGETTDGHLAGRGIATAVVATGRNGMAQRDDAAARPPGGVRSTREQAARAARSYTIRSGDSLHGIAERVLKDAGRWREIAKLNGLKDANRLIPGARLKLPAGESDT